MLPTHPAPRPTHRLRRSDAAALALLALLPWAFPGAWLLSRHWLLGADPPTYIFPYLNFVAQGLEGGRLLLWNPYAFGGLPALGPPEAAPLYPPHLLSLLAFGPIWTLKLRYILHLALAGVGMHLLLRHWRLAPGLALMGALHYQLSGYLVTKIALPGIGSATAWLPMLVWLNARFAHRPALGPGLAYAAAVAFFQGVFFPQMHITFFLFLTLLGAFQYLRFHASPTRARTRPAALLGPLLSAALLGTVLLALRYPGADAVSGLGRLGPPLLVGIGLLYAAWSLARRLRVGLDTRGLLRWGLGYLLVWSAGTCAALPQMASTLELAFHSSIEARQFDRDFFFTGAQAFGSLQNFLLMSAGAAAKNPVHNFALGPAPWLLATLGLALGLERRRRPALLMAATAFCIIGLYMDLPLLGELPRRLPFFRKLPGFSRYLSLANFALIAFALLAAREGLRRCPRRIGRPLTFTLYLVLAANLALLARHHTRLFQSLAEHPAWQPPAPIEAMLKRHFSPDDRVIVDQRGLERAFSLGMYGARIQRPLLPGYGPMRPPAHETLLRAHNAFHHFPTRDFLDDYRIQLWAPAPSPWSRAFAVRGFLFTPGTDPPPGLETIDSHEGWRLALDRKAEAWPPAWPETKLDRAPPVPPDLPGWSLDQAETEPGLLRYRATLPAGSTGCWLVLPQPWFPGWQARVNGRTRPIDQAYGALMAIPLQPGANEVRLVYAPPSFALGWTACLAALWGWAALLARRRGLWPYALGLAWALAWGLAIHLFALRSLWLLGAAVLLSLLPALLHRRRRLP